MNTPVSSSVYDYYSSINVIKGAIMKSRGCVDPMVEIDYYSAIEVLKDLIMKSQGYVDPMVEINTLKTKMKLPIYTFYNIRHMGWCHMVITLEYHGQTIYAHGWGEEAVIIKKISNEFVKKFYTMFPDVYDKLHTCSYKIAVINKMFNVNYSETDENTGLFVNLLKRKYPNKSWKRMRVGDISIWQGCPIYNPYQDRDTKMEETLQPNENTKKRMYGHMILRDRKN